MTDDSLKKRSTIRKGRSHANAAAAANNICRTVSGCSSSKVQTPNSPLSYFFSITIAQPKIRIKIPKALAKTMRRRSDHDHDHDQCNDNLNKPKKIFGKKFGLILCKVFGHKKGTTQETCSSKCENGKACSNGMGTSGGLADRKKAKMLEKFEFDDMGSVKSMMRSCEIDLMRSCEIDVSGDQGKQSRDVAEVALPNLKNILESEEEGGGKTKEKKQEKFEDGDQGRRQQQQPCTEYKQGQLSFKNFFKKKNGLSCFGGNTRRNISRSNGVPATDIVTGRKENSSERLKKARSVGNNSHEQMGVEGGRKQRVDEGLCKKRILMGEKCRPLSHSGSLHYDKDGTLLTDILPQ